MAGLRQLRIIDFPIFFLSFLWGPQYSETEITASKAQNENTSLHLKIKHPREIQLSRYLPNHQRRLPVEAHFSIRPFSGRLRCFPHASIQTIVKFKSGVLNVTRRLNRMPGSRFFHLLFTGLHVSWPHGKKVMGSIPARGLSLWSTVWSPRACLPPTCTLG